MLGCGSERPMIGDALSLCLMQGGELLITRRGQDGRSIGLFPAIRSPDRSPLYCR